MTIFERKSILYLKKIMKPFPITFCFKLLTKGNPVPLQIYKDNNTNIITNPKIKVMLNMIKGHALTPDVIICPVLYRDAIDTVDSSQVHVPSRRCVSVFSHRTLSPSNRQV